MTNIKRKIDYKLKADVIRLGIPKKINFIDKQEYQLYAEGIIPSVNVEDMYLNMLHEHGQKYINEGRKINNAYYKRVARLRRRIERYLKSGDSIFVTLTFTDEVLNSTNEKTRRTYVRRYLKSIADHYVANIDYGIDDRYTHREHYHAVIVVPWINDKWNYGFIWREKVTKVTSDKMIAKYISKLTNHAIKDSTRRCCYIYSRG